MKPALFGLHPAVSAGAVGLVLFGLLGLNHPLCAAVAFLGGCLADNNGRGKRRWLWAFCLLPAITNPLFSHAGVTVLCYLPDGNPLTLESICYGLYAGSVLAAVMVWGQLFFRWMTADRLEVLLGSMLPQWSLFLAMTLRLTPRLAERGREMAGLSPLWQEKGQWRKKVRAAFSLALALLGWALENGVETAMAMKVRGYGLGRRTAFVPVTVTRRDRWALVGLGGLAAALMAAVITKSCRMVWYPKMMGPENMVLAAVALGLYGVACFWLAVFEWMEERRWARHGLS